ncbi:MAG: hypothetical protein RLZZ253_762 [Verrucomicrobiota bacterium]|jgi:hypothetical protein
MRRFAILAILLLLSRPDGVSAEDKIAKSSPAQAYELPKLPWHMANLWWEIPPTEDFQSLDIDFRVNGEADPSKINLYIAPIGLGRLNEISFYGGIQTNIGGYGVSPDSPTGAYLKGKGCIFSRWGNKDLDTSFVRPAADGLVEAASYEGDFASGRRSYAWGQGAYTYSLRRLSYEKDKDGAEWTWVGAFVTDKSKGDFTYVSSLKFPGRTLRFWGRHSAFIEIYGGKQVEIAALPPLEIAISHPRINGKPVAVGRLTLAHPDKGPVSPPIMSGTLSEDGSEVVFRLHNRLLEAQASSTQLLPR